MVNCRSPVNIQSLTNYILIMYIKVYDLRKRYGDNSLFLVPCSSPSVIGTVQSAHTQPKIPPFGDGRLLVEIPSKRSF